MTEEIPGVGNPELIDPPIRIPEPEEPVDPNTGPLIPTDPSPVVPPGLEGEAEGNARVHQ